VQQTKSDPSWGAVLIDIAEHLPASYGDEYWDSDLMTAGHETTHGINSELRNNWNKTGKKANGFYVLEDRAAIIVEPNIRKSDCAPFIPASLHGPRYDLYIVGQTEWDDTPTYVFDEWTAYTNGAAVSVDLVQHGLYHGGWTDAVFGELEFVVYSTAIAQAVQKGDPTYWSSADGTQFKEFIAFNVKRAMDNYRIGSKMSDYTWADQDTYLSNMKTSADAADWRAFVNSLFGDAWVSTVIFGDPTPTDPDAGPPSVDAGPPPAVDAGPPPVVDAGPPPAVDAGPPPSTDDDDGDGIVDEQDLCSHTPAGAVVWTYGDWIGCSVGQHRDGGGGHGDADGDGVPDNKDRCTHTPSGARVWKYGDWIGCAGGEHRDK
jgi:hypothetical protein